MFEAAQRLVVALIHAEALDAGERGGSQLRPHRGLVPEVAGMVPALGEDEAKDVDRVLGEVSVTTLAREVPLLRLGPAEVDPGARLDVGGHEPDDAAGHHRRAGAAEKATGAGQGEMLDHVVGVDVRDRPGGEGPFPRRIEPVLRAKTDIGVDPARPRRRSGAQQDAVRRWRVRDQPAQARRRDGAVQGGQWGAGECLRGRERGRQRHHPSPATASMRQLSMYLRAAAVIVSAGALAGCASASQPGSPSRSPADATPTASPAAGGLQTAPTPSPDKAAAKLPDTFFGMHDLQPELGWPTVKFGALRLWDAHVTWRELEPQRGEFDWTLLDQWVAAAERHGVAVDLVLGQTPQWASAFPERAGLYGKGAAAPPLDMGDWRNYVQAVASRYRGRIASYEIWNEPNWQGSFYGSPQQLLTMTRVAARAVDNVDPAAQVVSPSFVLADRYNWLWLRSFVRNGGANGVDVLAIHGYLLPGHQPEEAVAYLRRIRALLSHYHVSRPIWDTEHNVLKAHNRAFTPSVGAAVLARSYLLAPTMQVSRLYWYGWRNGQFGGVRLTRADGTATSVAVAYRVVRRWMKEQPATPCIDNAGTWTCTWLGGEGRSIIAWAPGGGRLTVPQWAHTLETLDDQNRAVQAGGTVELGAEPVRLAS